MAIETINPATGSIIKQYKTMLFSEVRKIIEDSHQAYLNWGTVTLAEKTKKLGQVAKILSDHKSKYAHSITEEMGKPIKFAKAEIEKCVWLCKHFAEHAAEYLQPRNVKTEMSKSYVCYQPLGVIFAIMPWNFPFWQAFRFAAPALMAGNGCILKPASITSGCGLMIEKIFHEADFPENLFRTIFIETELAEKIIHHPRIAGATLTGSVRAGRIVGGEAAGNIKKVVLELGGSDPYIILEDADLDHAAEQCVTSRLNNSGQVCIAAKRLIVVDAIRPMFEQKVLEIAKKYKTGDPMDENTQLGPLAREDLRHTVHQQVQQCVNQGAQLLLGGQIPNGPGFFYPATVLKDVRPGMPAYDEEIFGPVIAFLRAKDETEAIQIANDSSFGLGAAVFTKDLHRGEKVALQLAAGACCVNTLVATDPRLPFGGIKSSGFGRELGAEGIREFTNVKTISVAGSQYEHCNTGKQDCN